MAGTGALPPAPGWCSGSTLAAMSGGAAPPCARPASRSPRTRTRPSTPSSPTTTSRNRCQERIDSTAFGARRSTLPLFFVHREATLDVIGQRVGVILGAGVQPEALRTVAPGALDRPPQKVPAQSLADEL